MKSHIETLTVCLQYQQIKKQSYIINSIIIIHTDKLNRGLRLLLQSLTLVFPSVSPSSSLLSLNEKSRTKTLTSSAVSVAVSHLCLRCWLSAESTCCTCFASVHVSVSLSEGMKGFHLRIDFILVSNRHTKHRDAVKILRKHLQTCRHDGLYQCS